MRFNSAPIPPGVRMFDLQPVRYNSFLPASSHLSVSVTRLCEVPDCDDCEDFDERTACRYGFEISLGQPNGITLH